MTRGCGGSWDCHDHSRSRCRIQIPSPTLTHRPGPKDPRPGIVVFPVNETAEGTSFRVVFNHVVWSGCGQLLPLVDVRVDGAVANGVLKTSGGRRPIRILLWLRLPFDDAAYLVVWDLAAFEAGMEFGHFRFGHGNQQAARCLGIREQVDHKGFDAVF